MNREVHFHKWLQQDRLGSKGRRTPCVWWDWGAHILDIARRLFLEAIISLPVCKEVAWGTWRYSSAAAGKSALHGPSRKSYHLGVTQAARAAATCRRPSEFETWKDE